MSEIRVNTITSAEGTSAPTMTYGFQVPTGMGITGAGSVNITGVVTATSFSGDGSALTGIAVTETVRTDTITVAGVSTFTGVSNFTGAVNVDATTDSTSATTGSLIVDGGLGVAKNVYIGAGLSVAGTLTYEDVTSVDSVGLITAKSGVNITGGELKVGTAVTIGSAGVSTFIGAINQGGGGGITIKGAEGGDANFYLYADEGDDNADKWLLQSESDGYFALKNYNSGSWETSIKATGDNNVELYYNDTKRFETTNDGTVTAGIATATGGVTINADNKYLSVGAGGTGDLQLSHNGTDSIIQNNTGNLEIRASELRFRTITGETIAQASINGEMALYYDNNEKFRTTYEGTKITGFTSTTAGLGVTGGMFEGTFIKAGKLSDNLQIGISTSNIHVFTTTETTTATPNIKWNDTYALSSKMKVGDAVTVTIVTTAAAAGYAAAITIDGNAVTEEWNGGSAPSAGGSGGYDVYTYTLIRKATGTGDTGWICLANVSNFA